MLRPAIVPSRCLVFFYGGGWHRGDKDHYGFVARAYAAIAGVRPGHLPKYDEDILRGRGSPDPAA